MPILATDPDEAGPDEPSLTHVLTTVLAEHRAHHHAQPQGPG